MKLTFPHLEWQCEFNTVTRLIRTQRRGLTNTFHFDNAHLDLQTACMAAVAEQRRSKIHEQFNALETFK